MDAPRVIIGTIGYYPFVQGYPLGPAFLERLQTPPWPDDVRVREMNWGPIAIVQEMQAAPRPPERVVLVTAVDRGQPLGGIHCRRWQGGAMDAEDLQARIFEAVTGVVHIDNLLAIGEHFGVWPREVITVEVRLPYDHVGDYILDELRATPGDPGSVGEQPLSAEMAPIVERLATLTRRAALEGARGIPDLVPLHADELTAVSEFCQNQPVSEPIIYGRR